MNWLNVKIKVIEELLDSLRDQIKEINDKLKVSENKTIRFCIRQYYSWIKDSVERFAIRDI